MRRIITLAMGVTMLLLIGCGEKKCFFVTQDSRGVKEGTLVVWEKEIVGRVDTIEKVSSGTKIIIRLAKKYQNLIHIGVMGSAEVDESLPLKSKVLLVGGKDEMRPFLKDGDQISEFISKDSGIVSADVVGYQTFTITKGETDIRMPFVNGKNDGEDQKFFTLEFFRKEAMGGDSVRFYDFQSNLIFGARAELTHDGLHFFSEKTGEVVDHCPFPPVFFADNQLYIYYHRETNVTSQLTIEGSVFLEESVFQVEKKIIDLESLSDWMRWRIFHQIYQEVHGGVFTNILMRGNFGASQQALDTKQGFVQSVLESLGQDSSFFFYLFDGENKAQLIAFDPVANDFTDKEGNYKISVDSRSVSGFGAVLDKYKKSTIPQCRRLPADIVEELNQLLKERFFDEKKLCELVFKDGTKRCVTINPEAMSVRDAKTAIQYNLSRSDIVGLRSILSLKDLNETYSVRGKVDLLSEDDVREYELNLLPNRRIWFWTWLGYLFQLVLGIITNVVSDKIKPLFLPETYKAFRRSDMSIGKKVLKVLMVLSGMWFLKLLQDIILIVKCRKSKLDR